MCYCDTSASAYTSAGPLSLKQNGVYTFVITSGCTDCPLRTQFTVSAATAGSTTLGVAVGPRQLIADQLLAKAYVIRAMHERAQLCQDPQTEFASSEGVWESAASTTFCECTATRSCRRNELLKSTTRLDSS